LAFVYCKFMHHYHSIYCAIWMIASSQSGFLVVNFTKCFWSLDWVTIEQNQLDLEKL
jgi:hypothetical protein